ncbi:type VII secretion protein EccB [Pseudonocardia ailaonensis]|uniref:Type VII secretion protein EccB n=1 Tax=Pseudonocardia ailaonensis TaxID=367279 RepID=A0ABN2NRL9_9PSEU
MVPPPAPGHPASVAGSRPAEEMPPPATRDQADAHRYGMRRLEAALVRADPVPLHEQLRAQRRAAVVGVLLALLGLAGAGVLAKLAPAPEWTGQTVVVAGGSGAVYAVIHGPDRLVPVPDLLAARLVLAALGSPAPAAEPVLVPDEDLGEAPRTGAVDLPATPGVRLGGPAIPARWAVCDGPVVLAGTLAPVAPVGALRVRAPGGEEYAVLDGVRHAVDPGDGAVVGALGLAGVPVRPVGAEVLSAVPEGPPLRSPRLPGGSAAPGTPGRVGDVLATTGVDGSRHYLAVVPDGVQEVPATLADVLRAQGGAGPREVPPSAVADVPRVTTLAATGWPAAAPRWEAPTGIACATWVDGRAGLAVLPALPLTGAVPVAGGRVRAVVGAGGAVRSVSPTGGGTVWLISSAGTAHGVADAPTASALGLPGALPDAPEAMLRLLPTGPALDLGEVRRAVG